MAIFIVVNFPSNYALDKGGLRFGVIFGVFLTVIGMWIKCAVNKSFVYVYVGQIIAAIGQPFLLCAPAKLAAYWYGQDERVIAVTIGTAFQPVGVAIGYVIPSFFVTEEDSLPEYKEQAR